MINPPKLATKDTHTSDPEISLKKGITTFEDSPHKIGRKAIKSIIARTICSPKLSTILAKLAKSNILTINDFADLATFELIDKEEGILKDLDLDEDLINKMIMKARENWFTEKA